MNDACLDIVSNANRKDSLTILHLDTVLHLEAVEAGFLPFYVLTLGHRKGPLKREQ